jgi:hypothetical protein
MGDENSKREILSNWYLINLTLFYMELIKKKIKILLKKKKKIFYFKLKIFFEFLNNPPKWGKKLFILFYFNKIFFFFLEFLEMLVLVGDKKKID